MPRTRTIARFTIEALSPLAIASGEEDALLDNLLARDANGLPIVPATSIAGALRARIGTIAEQLFGFQKDNDGQRSAVTLTDALFHWSDDKPRDGLVDPLAMENDPLCAIVLRPEPMKREHVRLNHRGTVEGDGKFSRIAVPAGARFTFEVVANHRSQVDALAAVLKENLSLGGAVRSGYGKVKLISEGVRDLDLSSDNDWLVWQAFSTRDLGTAAPIEMTSVGSYGGPVSRVWGIDGQIEGPFLIGSEARGSDEDRAPYQEAWIEWESGSGSLGSQRRIVPGTSIKGPIRHRTLFHLRRANVSQPEAEVDALFGSAAKGAGGGAGRLRFEDIVVDSEASEFRQTHVGLDRFTGGARDKVLFTDAMLWRPRLSFRFEETSPLSAVQRAALLAAMNDLASGLLGIGAEWGEGAGVFESASLVVPELPTVEAIHAD